jgi:hypothetical protein
LAVQPRCRSQMVLWPRRSPIPSRRRLIQLFQVCTICGLRSGQPTYRHHGRARLFFRDRLFESKNSFSRARTRRRCSRRLPTWPSSEVDVPSSRYR